MPADLVLIFTLSLYFLGFVLYLSIGKVSHQYFIGWLSVFLNFVGFGLSLYIFFQYPQSQSFSFDWIRLGDHPFACSLTLDPFSRLMLPLVQFVSLLVQLFSIPYLKNDRRFPLYFAYINLFILAMLGLVISSNLLLIFLFWELVGFSSYLLIGFWFERDTAARASLKAFIFNRISDAALLAGICLLFANFKTLELSALQQLAAFEPFQMPHIIAILIFGGCIGKSAQIPFQVWLPDAMEGPTPASALIHAATMVAAGIFLLARLDFLLSPEVGILIAAIGSVTAVLAAYSAIFQTDIKKVLAYSTVSQLGLMMMAIGVGATYAALFHLYTHAFFKAGLFLIAGAVIHHFHHEQNMLKMGGLLSSKPILSLSYLICGAALVGLPFTSGFLSKDAVILSAWNWALNQQNPLYIFIPIAGILTSMFTAFYITRQFILVFLGSEIKIKWSKPDLYECAILPLALASLWLLHGHSPFHYDTSYFSNLFKINRLQHEWLVYLLTFLSFITIILASYRFAFRSKSFSNTLAAHIGLSHFGLDKFYTDQIVPLLIGKQRNAPATVTEASLHPGKVRVTSTQNNNKQLNISDLAYKIDQYIIGNFIQFITKLTLNLAKLSDLSDQHLVDGLVSRIYRSANFLGLRLKRIQNGRVQSYLIALLLFFISILILLVLL